MFFMRYFLEDEKVGLRCLTEDDCKGGYADWFNDPDVCRYNDHHRFPMTYGDLKGFVDGCTHTRTEIVMAVEEKESQTHIGNISLQHIDMVNRQAEIAFIFGEKTHWGKGFATSAARLIIDHAIKELGMNRIYFGTLDDNVAMQKVGEKLNFKQGGVRRQALYKHGRFHDIYDYDLVASEWCFD